jgi:hypothetical protein
MGNEQREFHRADLQLPIHYRLAGTLSGLWQHGTLVNLSAVGLRLATRELLELNARLEVEIVLPSRNNPCVFLGVVLSEQPVGGHTEYGVAFEEVTLEKGQEIDELVRFLKTRDE